MKSEVTSFESRSLLLRQVERAATYVRSPVPLDSWGRTTPALEEQWAREHDEETFNGVAAAWLRRICVLAKCFQEVGLVDAFDAAIAGNPAHECAKKLLGLAACAWPFVWWRTGLKSPAFGDRELRQRGKDAHQVLLESVKMVLRGDSESLAEVCRGFRMIGESALNGAGVKSNAGENVQPGPGPAAGVGEAESQQSSSTKPGSKQSTSRKMTEKKANQKAMQLAEADPTFVHGTQREWKSRIGCSVGLVAKLSFWKEVAEKTGRARKGKAPKAVALTEKVLAATADPDAELERLKAEQKADAEPSPLEPDPPNRPRRNPRVRKKP